MIAKFHIKLEHIIMYRTINQENPCSNILAAISELGQFRSLHVASVHLVVQMSGLDTALCENLPVLILHVHA